MNDLLARACDLFVAPAADARVAPAVVHARRADSSIAILGRSREASSLATALARRLRRDARAAVAVVATWEPAPEPAGAEPPQGALGTGDVSPAAGVLGTGGALPAAGALATAAAVPAAGALARRLAARGLAARAGGRLVLVRLPAEPSHCLAAINRMRAASGDAATVTLFQGPLAAWMVPVLADNDRVLVHLAIDAPRELAVLAVAGLAETGMFATAVAWSPGPLTRAFVRRGLLPGPALPAVCTEAGS